MLSSSSIGVFGVRGEHWIAPSSKFSLRIVGIGVDYAFNQSQISYTSDLIQPTTLTINSHHILGSVNVVTYLKNRFVGYLTLQGGILLPKEKSQAVSPNILVDYRAGYGLQIYVKNNLGFTLEAGCGGGVYLKTGVVFWIF